MVSYLKNCPAGHYADRHECPYPADRSGRRFVCHCTNGDCSWEVIAATPDLAAKAWNYLPDDENF